MLHDLRRAFRSLRRAPAYSVAAIAALALAIGANTSLFSLIEATLLRPSPYPKVEQLLMLRESSNTFAESTVAYPDFKDWRAQSTAQFSGMAALPPPHLPPPPSGRPRRAPPPGGSPPPLQPLRPPPPVGPRLP